jgi:hypothetical protein
VAHLDRDVLQGALDHSAGDRIDAGHSLFSAALRILGRECDPDFCTFHRILNRAAWSSRAVARQLLIVLVKALVPSAHRASPVQGKISTLNGMNKPAPTLAQIAARFKRQAHI